MKLRYAPIVFSFVLAPGIAGCSCCGAARLCFGPQLNVHQAPEGPPPQCAEQYQRCLPGCKNRPDRTQMEACQAVCASERKLCEQPPAK